ncbi:B3/B4 domain-containing protein [Clostridium sp. DL1XJH146]
MINIKISEELKNVCPQMALGCIQAKVTVQPGNDALWEEINNYCEIVKKEIPIDKLAYCPQIKDGREIYKKLGKAPSKYRISSEALVRRVLQNKGVYKVNNVVDVNNLISMKSLYSLGSYDIDKIKGSIVLGIGKEGASYKGIGKGIINVENIPVFSDDAGLFGSPTSDSEVAMIRNETKNIVMNIISFSGTSELNKYMEMAKEKLEKYAYAEEVEFLIVE